MLASASPRRHELLAHLGVEFTVATPTSTSRHLPGEAPVPYVRRLAVEKAHAVGAPSDSLVIAADTTVDLGGDILGKPEDDDEARVDAAPAVGSHAPRAHRASRCGWVIARCPRRVTLAGHVRRRSPTR